MSDEHWPPLPPTVIHDPTIRDRCFRAFIRLYLRAWNGNTLIPIRLTEDELSTLLQKSRAQMYDLLQEMTSAKLIRWYRDGPHFRITTAFQAPAPSAPQPPFGSISVESGNPDSDEKMSGNPDSKPAPRLEIQTQNAPRIRESGIPGQVKTAPALKELINTDDDDDESLESHQHHHHPPAESGFPDSETQVFLNLVRAQAADWLIQAGVWTDEAEKLAERLAENEVLRGHNPHLPVRADILGWIAALKNRADVNKPDAMLAYNLRHGRRAPAKLRPPLVCANCQRIEGHCRCALPTAWGYPDEYITRALDNEVSTWSCRTCHAVPCACPPEPEPTPAPETNTLRGVRDALPEPTITGWNGIGMAPEIAIQGALSQLQMELPKATFDTWVRDARFAGFNSGKFTLRFHNAYARDWCESRLSSTLARILNGIMNQPVELEFIA